MKRYKKVSDIRVGVIGYSPAYHMGRTHLTDMQSAGMVPTAVAELNPKLLETAATDFPGIETYGSVTDMLRKSSVDLLAIITPHNTHHKLAIQCLRAGRHVVCEKPFAITTTECDGMIAEAKKRKSLLTVYHNRHWDGCILEAMDHILQKKEIGDIYRIEAHMGGFSMPFQTWRGSRSLSGGILYDWGVHLLEYSLQLIDSPIVEVSSYARNGYWSVRSQWKADSIEDEAFAVVRFKNGVWLNLTISHMDSNPKHGMLEISGSEGSYIMNMNDYEIIKRNGDQKTILSGKNREGQCHLFYREIANHLVKGKAMAITPTWARRPIHILDLANRSAAKGCAMKAKYK